MEKRNYKRAEELLRAVIEILNKCENSCYVEDFFSQVAYYDGCECDGYCLKEDIEMLLEDMGE